jgi:hypothetical protein
MAARTFDGFLLESGVFADAALAQAKRDAAANGIPLWRRGAGCGVRDL